MVIGLWKVYPWLTIAVATGIILTGVFSLRALYRAFFPERDANAAPPHQLPPLTWPEISAIALLLAVSIAIGLYPKPWIQLIDDGLRSPLFQSILTLP